MSKRRVPPRRPLFRIESTGRLWYNQFERKKDGQVRACARRSRGEKRRFGVVNASEKEETLFRSVPVTKAILTLALPTIISQVITILYNMADTFFIGQLGDPRQVAAATLAMPLFMLMTALSNLFGVGGASLISRQLGRGERAKASRTCAFCVWTGIAVALLYGVLVLVLRPVLLPMLGAGEDTGELTASYLFWTVGLGAVPTVLNPTLAHLVRAEGHARPASFGVALGGILNIILDPIFIYGLRLQITGAAIATLLSNTMALLYFFWFIRKQRAQSVITLSPKPYTLGQGIPAEVIGTGLPSFLISMMATVSNTVLNRIIAGYSNEAVAGMGIAKKVNLLAFAVTQGITQGTLPLLGYNFTAGNRKRMAEIIRVLFTLNLAVALVIALLLYTNASVITKLFINDSATVEYGSRFLHIIGCACPMTAVTFFALTVFQATGRKIQPILLSVLRKGTIDVPAMFLFHSLLGINGVAWATPTAEAISVLTALILVIPYIRKLLR